MGAITILQMIFYVALAHCERNPYMDALRSNPWQSVQQYVEVRPGAYLFYWLYYADGTAAGADTKPLVIWIQGGPGLAATGIANFAEIGPLDMNMLPRNHTWVKGRNLLLIDHPVGTGFSYATNKSLYVETDRQIAIDLSKAIRTFLRRHKEFRKTPTYIFGQSYGGKITPRLGYYLHTAIVRKNLVMNFKGIGIGGGWVHPKESIPMQPEYLYMMGIIDQSTYTRTSNWAREACTYIERHDYLKAASIHSHMYQILYSEAGMTFNFNNINQLDPSQVLERLTININRYVKPTLSHVVNQSLDWHYLSHDVWSKLKKNFFMSSVKFLELLLNNTKLEIAIYNGNLDVITPVAGASNWVHKLHWHGREAFRNAMRIPIDGDRNGFYKQIGRLSFWWVYGAGHWVPEDNPVAMKQILDHVMKMDQDQCSGCD